MGEVNAVGQLAIRAIKLAYSIDRAWYEDNAPYEYDTADDLMELINQANALGLPVSEGDCAMEYEEQRNAEKAKRQTNVWKG